MICPESACEKGEIQIKKKNKIKNTNGALDQILDLSVYEQDSVYRILRY